MLVREGAVEKTRVREGRGSGEERREEEREE